MVNDQAKQLFNEGVTASLRVGTTGRCCSVANSCGAALIVNRFP
jgi:hypothetical protein